MKRSVWAVLATGLLLGGAGAVRADVWDLDTINDEDDGTGTDNELTHGLVQVHDLASEAATADQDWYRVQTMPFSSYEFLADGLTGDVFNAVLPVDLMADSTTVLASSLPIPNGIGATRSLRWINSTSVAEDQFVRVLGTGTTCGTACSTADQYTARFFETTVSISRYNNAGTQVTVLLLHNPAGYTINGRVFFWNAAGGLVASPAFVAGPRQLLSVTTSSFTGATSGTITIAHDGRYGDLTGKAVALEPSTGFSFDTPVVHRPM